MNLGGLIDSFLYIILPIIVYSAFGKENIENSIITVFIINTIYSLYVYKKENRINKSFICFNIIYTIYIGVRYLISNDYQAYCYDVNFFIGIAIIIAISSMLKKNILKIVYIDILKACRVRELVRVRLLKLKYIDLSLNKLMYIVNIHLLIISFIKVYSIGIYGESNYTLSISLEIIISVMFMTVNIYLISKLSQHTREYINDKSLNKEKNLQGCRVISIDKYKNK